MLNGMSCIDILFQMDRGRGRERGGGKCAFIA